MEIKKLGSIIFISVLAGVLVWVALGNLHLETMDTQNVTGQEVVIHVRIALGILLGAILSGYLLLEALTDKPGLSFFKVFRQNPQPMWIFDIKTLKFMLVNEAAVKEYEFSKAEFYKMTVLDIRPEKAIADSQALNEKTKSTFPFRARGFDDDETIWQHQKKSGKVMYVKTIAFYTRYRRRNVALITVLDITGEYLQERQVKEQKELLDAVISSTDDFIWAVDRNLVPTASNSTYKRFIREITGLYVLPDVSNILTRYAETFMELQREYYMRALQGEKINTEKILDMGDFALVYLELKFSPVQVNGEIVGAVCFARNISERKRYVSNIERQVEVLQDIAVISSHDIRRPVSSIIGLLSLVDTRNPHNPENYQILEYMRLAAGELDAMIYQIVERCTIEINLNKDDKAKPVGSYLKIIEGFTAQNPFPERIMMQHPSGHLGKNAA